MSTAAKQWCEQFFNIQSSCAIHTSLHHPNHEPRAHGLKYEFPPLKNNWLRRFGGHDKSIFCSEIDSYARRTLVPVTNPFVQLFRQFRMKLERQWQKNNVPGISQFNYYRWITTTPWDIQQYEKRNEKKKWRCKRILKPRSILLARRLNHVLQIRSVHSTSCATLRNVPGLRIVLVSGFEKHSFVRGFLELPRIQYIESGIWMGGSLMCIIYSAESVLSHKAEEFYRNRWRSSSVTRGIRYISPRNRQPLRFRARLKKPSSCLRFSRSVAIQCFGVPSVRNCEIPFDAIQSCK